MTLQKYEESSPVAIFKDNAIIVHVLHVDGPYDIHCDGQIGGTFSWSDCGLELIFPPKCSQKMIKVSMSAFLPLRIEVYPGVYIVSAVYQFKCNIKHFDIPIILRLQHCVKLKSSEDCHKMWFASQCGDSIDIKHGNFDIGNSYGTLNLNRFCKKCIISSQKKSNKVKPIRIASLPKQNVQSKKKDSTKVTCSHMTNSPKHVPDASHDDHESSGGQYCSSSSIDSFPCISRREQEQIEKQWGYEWMLALPKDHSKLDKWNGIYSVYIKLAAWRKVSITNYCIHIMCTVCVITSIGNYINAVANVCTYIMCTCRFSSVVYQDSQ